MFALNFSVLFAAFVVGLFLGFFRKRQLSRFVLERLRPYIDKVGEALAEATLAHLHQKQQAATASASNADSRTDTNPTDND